MTRSIARTAKRESTRDAKMRAKAADSFQNFAQQLGIGADSQLSGGSYGYNPITRIRVLLEWIHRGSWLGGVAVDLVADDMTRAGIDLHGEMPPEDIEQLNRAATTYDIWGKVSDTVKWSRLYGGAIAVMLIDGQRPETPLRPETVGKGQFKGLMVFDRWMIEPSLNMLVTDLGPDLGKPMYYRVVADAPALPRMNIHYSRCLRLEGVPLPYWQKMTENLWGLSVLERLYDRMIAFDSATTGAAQLVYKSYIRTYSIENLREIVAAGGSALQGLVKYIDMMRRFQGIEGITLLDAKDTLAEHGFGGFGGLSEVLIQMGQQISGALQIPLVRLFGQSPVGLNSTGESDLRTYYDGINNQQNRHLKVPLTKIYRIMAQSEGIGVPEGFDISFRSLWILNDAEKAQIANSVATAVGGAVNSGIISPPIAAKELKQSSHTTGVFSNITDEEIEEMEQDQEIQDDITNEEKSIQLEGQRQQLLLPAKTKDSLGDYTLLNYPVVIEHEKGEMRYGNKLPANYGYIRRTDSAERGDQMDVFVGPAKQSTKIFIIDSYTTQGDFDEHKVMLCYDSASFALADFRSYYDGTGPAHRNGICTEVSTVQFQDFLRGDVSRPYAQTSDVEYTNASPDPSTVCAKCYYFVSGVCLNKKTARDPKVREIDGQKLVSPAGWCKEYA